MARTTTPETVSLDDALEAIGQGRWGVPELQRPFLWSPSKVRLLADSLLRDHAYGMFTLWSPEGDPGVVRHRYDDALPEPDKWILDGQQRITALAMLFGIRPLWWDQQTWDDVTSRNAVWFDTAAFLRDRPFLSSRPKASRVPLSSILPAGSDVHGALSEAGVNKRDAQTVSRRLAAVTRRLIPVVTLRMDVADAAANFRKINQAGTRVSAANLEQSLMTVHHPGFMLQSYLPFLTSLGEQGWDPDAIADPFHRGFRAVLAGASEAHTASFEEMAADRDILERAWESYSASWDSSLAYLRESGVGAPAVVPSTSLPAMLAVLIQAWPEAKEDWRALWWITQTVRTGTFAMSNAGRDAMSIITRGRLANASYSTALRQLHSRLDTENARRVTADDIAAASVSGRRPAGSTALRFLYAMATAEAPDGAGTTRAESGAAVWHPVYDPDSTTLGGCMLVAGRVARKAGDHPLVEIGATLGEDFFEAQAATGDPKVTKAVRDRPRLLATKINDAVKTLREAAGA